MLFLVHESETALVASRQGCKAIIYRRVIYSEASRLSVRFTIGLCTTAKL